MRAILYPCGNRPRWTGLAQLRAQPLTAARTAATRQGENDRGCEEEKSNEGENVRVRGRKPRERTEVREKSKTWQSEQNASPAFAIEVLANGHELVICNGTPPNAQAHLRMRRDAITKTKGITLRRIR